MNLKAEIKLLNENLNCHDEEVDKHFPKDESQVPAFTKAQYMNLFEMLQGVAQIYEKSLKLFGFKTPKKALEILVTNINEHSEMVNEIMDDTDYENWTKAEDEHYTGVFYCDLHKTVEETLEEMEEVKQW